MRILNKYADHVPYLYFISTTLYWFTSATKSDGILAFPILLLAIPFIWQLVKPNKELNFTLGVSFVCISSYLILIYLSDVLHISSLDLAKSFMIYSGLFVLTNIFMSLWIIRNSLKQTL